jgi:hypothetical protein
MKTASNKHYEADFKNWVKSHNVPVLSSSNETSLRPGQKVTYTNEYGVSFNSLTVMGFCEPQNGRCVYLNKDSYWYPVNPENLTVEDN